MRLAGAYIPIGIKLNPGKTLVLEAKDALVYFWIHENRMLTSVEAVERISNE